MKSFRMIVLLLLAVLVAAPSVRALEKQPASVYRARRAALGAKLQGGVAVLFAAEEPLLDLTPYRQDEDFYYLTGWTEPGAALLVLGEPQAGGAESAYKQMKSAYRQILFLPTRNLRMEKYTGPKLDASSPGVAQAMGVDAVEPMTEMAYNYINTHGKSLDGQPLGQYWLHGLGHMLGIDVHDPANYPAVLKPGMVFTIEPGIYIPEEKLGVRIECDFLVGADGKLIDLDAALPHTADEVEAAMQGK